MKKKKQFAAVLAVAIVWGMIFFRLSAHDEPEPEIKTPGHGSRMTGPVFMPGDTFSLSGDYRDPFLEAGRAGSSDLPSTRKPAAVPSVKVSKVREEVRWPSMEYGGIISQPASGRVLGWLKVEGRKYLVSAGDSYRDITVLELKPDRIRLSFQGEDRVVQLSTAGNI